MSEETDKCEGDVGDCESCFKECSKGAFFQREKNEQMERAA